jgi:hypothetical protein
MPRKSERWHVLDEIQSSIYYDFVSTTVMSLVVDTSVEDSDDVDECHERTWFQVTLMGRWTAATKPRNFESYLSLSLGSAPDTIELNFHFPTSNRCLYLVSESLQSSSDDMFMPSSHSDFILNISDEAFWFFNSFIKAFKSPGLVEDFALS